jgi:membrane protease YdiL (CAAX protease family)
VSTPPQSPEPGFWNRLFLSPSERRLRSGWRLAVQTALLLALIFCSSLVVLIPYFVFGGRDVNSLVFVLLSEVIEFFGVTLSVGLARRFVDRRSFSSLGLRLGKRAALDLLAGLLIAFGLMGAIFLAMSALGWLQFEGYAWQTQAPAAVLGGTLTMLFVFLLTGWNEELLSRGYHLQTLAGGTNLFWGVVLSSIVFGMLHLLNPGATWVAAVGIFFAGLLLAYAYVRTGRLWLSIGLHLGWNFFEGPVFGFLVSGLDFFHLTRIRVHGPVLWTGGNFGPEAGLIVLPAIALGALLIFFYSRFFPPEKSGS